MDLYIYMLTGTEKGKVEMLIKTPTFVKITTLLTVEGQEGLVGCFNINHILKLQILKEGDCWSFALGKFSANAQVPSDWSITLQDSFDTKCSPCLYLRAKSPLFIKPFLSINIVPEKKTMTAYDEFLGFLVDLDKGISPNLVKEHHTLIDDCGLDELDIYELIAELEARYGIEIDDTKFEFEKLTVNELFEVVQNGRT